MSRCAITSRLLLLLVAMCCWPATSRADAPWLLVTADGEGHVAACGSCPGAAGLGGLERRATAISDLRGQNAAGALLVDAGNWLAGEQSSASGGKVIVAAYDALHYDAVHLTPKDLYWGKEATLALLKDAKFAAVSGNLVDAATQKPIVQPYVVKTVGGQQRVAIVGVSEAPPGLDSLPHLQRQLAGIRIRRVTEALDEWLPKARAESQQVVVLYQGNGAGLRALRGRLAGSAGVIVGVSGVRPESAPVGPPTVIAADKHGRSVARIEFGADVKVTQVPIEPAMRANPEMTALLARFQPPTLTNPDPTLPARDEPVIVRGGTDRPPEKPPTTGGSSGGGGGVVENHPPTTQPPVISSTQPAKPPPYRVAARQSYAPQGLAAVKLTGEQVDAAIDRGREFLWRHLEEEHGKRVGAGLVNDGPDLLSALALVHAGVVQKHPEFEAKLRQYLDQSDPRRHQLPTYEAGLYCLLIDAYGDPTYLPKMRDMAQYLLEMQGQAGSWGYGVPVPESAFGPRLARAGSAMAVFGGTPVDHRAGGDIRLSRVGEYLANRDGDNSVSQFALLGLHTASRWRVRVPADAWSRTLATVRDRQCDDGGWDYQKNGAYGYGSMTCAGVCALAITRHQLGQPDPTADEALERGLGWLDKNFSVSANPGRGAGYLYYYLYSVERTGRILDTEFIGKHEWYPAGARFLIDAQKVDGKWIEEGEVDPRPATSFALLFLTRATATLDPHLVTGGSGELRTSLSAAPPARLYVILDASGSMIDEMDGRPKFDLARDAVRAMLPLLGPKSQVGLRVYGHRKRSIETGADEDTELLLPLAEYDAAKFEAALATLRARGKTPMALSLEQAASDLQSAASDANPVTVVLLTDGGEDTNPPRDPVAASARLAGLKGVTLHVVGFDVNQEDWNRQLRQMADAARGQYWPAPRGEELKRSLRSALLGDPDGFVVQDAAGKEVFRGRFGDRKRLLEGKYTMVTQFGGREFRQELWINTGAQTAVAFDAGQAMRDPAGRPIAATGADHSHAADAPKFCTHCGALLKLGAKFCTECGQPVNGPK